jgi:hypothetical protein
MLICYNTPHTMSIVIKSSKDKLHVVFVWVSMGVHHHMCKLGYWKQMLVVGCCQPQRQMAVRVGVMFIWEGEQSALG